MRATNGLAKKGWRVCSRMRERQRQRQRERERERERVNHEWGGGGGSAGKCLGSRLPAAMRILKRGARRIDVRIYMFEFLLKIMNLCGPGNMVYTWDRLIAHKCRCNRWTAGLSPSLPSSLSPWYTATPLPLTAFAPHYKVSFLINRVYRSH